MLYYFDKLLLSNSSFGVSNEDDQEGVQDDNGLFSGAAFDKEDEEAEAIYDMVDNYVDSRRKVRRDAKLEEELKLMHKAAPKIQAQFADAKADLAQVSYDEWNSIQDPGNYSRQKKQKTQHFTAAPNSLLEQARAEQSMNMAIDPSVGLNTPMSGVFTPAMTPVADLTKVGQAKQTIIRAKLEAASDSVTGGTVINTKGYLTELNSVKIQTAAEVGDKKRARLLLDSVVQTNPTHGPAWIARARLEEADGKTSAARKLILQGTKNCPTVVDVWLEAARMHDGREAMEILADAVKQLPTAVPLWLYAARLETDEQRKKRVLRKALEQVPNSVKLWRAAVQLETPEDAKHMLMRAVECIPSSVEMWLALAKLEDYQNAKKVLNRARSTIPTERAIWITAAQLEEANGSDPSFVRQVIKKAVKSLVAHGVIINREQWLAEAEACEKSNSIATCQAIVMETIGIGVEDEDRKSTWNDDAEQALSRGSIHTTRAIYAHTTTVFPGKKSVWLRLAELERKHGDAASLEAVLDKSVKYCINSEVLWLMYAKHKWHMNDVDGARAVLKSAFNANPDNEAIWLAAVKLEKENGHFELAREVLARARSTAGTARVWMKSALLERDLKNEAEEEKLLEEAIEKYPMFHKCHLMLGQLRVRQGRVDDARLLYHKAIKSITGPDSIPIWLELAKLEGQTVGPSRARAIMEKARLKNPATPELWLASLRNEFKFGEKRVAFNMLAKALQECPRSGILWAEAIAMEQRPQKKARSVDALRKCDSDPHVVLAVAQLLQSNRQIEKARTWFNRSVTLDNDFGDGWAAYYQFEVENGAPELQEAVLKRAIEADPHHGEKWISVSKDITIGTLSTEEILKRVAKQYAGLYTLVTDGE